MKETVSMLVARCAGLLGLLLLPLSLSLPLAPTLALGADNVRVRMNTTAGPLILELDASRAPGTVDNFLEYARNGFYDGTIFHRVIENFMIQGGGFTEDFKRKPTRPAIRNEADNGLRNEAYTIAMARTNAPHSATAQFFINAVDNPNLDHTARNDRGWGYTVFGRVVEGRDIVDVISRVPTGPGGPFSRDAPRLPIVLRSVEILDDTDPTGMNLAAEPATELSETAGVEESQ